LHDLTNGRVVLVAQNPIVENIQGCIKQQHVVRKPIRSAICLEVDKEGIRKESP
jgi:hypothetical protein